MCNNRPLALFITLVFLVTMTFGNSNVAHASQGQVVQHADHGQSFLGRIFRFVTDNPFEAVMLGAVTVLAGYASFQIFKGRLRVEAAAPVAGIGGAGARAVDRRAPRREHGAPDIRGGRGRDGGLGFRDPAASMIGVDHNLERALLDSRKEHEFRQRHQMQPVDHTFNVDVFRQLERIRDLNERVLFLQALLYDLEQRFIDRQLLAAFVESVTGLDVEAAIDGFQQLAREGWSLLQLAPELGELNPHGDLPMLDFRALRAQFARLRMRLAAGACIEDLRFEVEKCCFNAFDRALLDLLVRYLWELGGNEPLAANPITPQTHERVRLAMEHLLGEEFRALPRIEALLRAPLLPPAAARVEGAPLIPPAAAEAAAPREELPPEELRRRRLELFDKKDKSDH